MSNRFVMRWHGNQLAFLAGEGAADGVEDAAEHLKDVSVDLVPLEHGELRESAEVSADRPAKQAAVSYDGPYAVIQHERINWRHDAGRVAKYLGRPFLTERPEFRRLIAQAIRRRWGL